MTGDEIVDMVLADQRAYYKAKKERARLRKLADKERKLAARLRKEEIEAYEEDRPRVRFCAGKSGKKVWGC